MKRLLPTTTLALVLLSLLPQLARAADGKLQDGDFVGIIGDSITEQRLYSLFIEDYLLMCRPKGDLRISQFGWGGETSWGFERRMMNDQVPFKVTVATTCFGMNDGGYSPMNDDKAKRYHDAMTEVVKKLKAGGTRFIVVGSPGAVDFDTFRRSPELATMYNKTLASLADIAKQVAAEQGTAYADVHTPMVEAMTKAKAKYGKEYHVGGGDGVHPERNGHLVMAYAFLKGLGCDGNIGTITLNAATGAAEASEGHKVLSSSRASVEVESSRYPFCLSGDPKSPGATSGIVEFFPFNEELNRFKLVVKGLDGGKAKITWGNESKEFPAEQLAKGINLAAEFVNDNPFSEPFKQVERKISEQQQAEVPLVKSMVHNLLEYERLAPEERAAFDRVREKLVAKDKELRDASAEAVKPVKHVIKVEIVR